MALDYILNMETAELTVNVAQTVYTVELGAATPIEITVEGHGDSGASAAHIAATTNVHGVGTGIAVAGIDDIPAASTATPAALGVAAAGSTAAYARGDHVHAMPSAGDVGAEATGAVGTHVTDYHTAPLDEDHTFANGNGPVLTASGGTKYRLGIVEVGGIPQLRWEIVP